MNCRLFVCPCIYFSTKVLIEDTIFVWDCRCMGPAFYVVTKPRKGLAICRARAVSSFLSHIKTLSMVRPRESNLRPPAQAVKRLSD